MLDKITDFMLSDTEGQIKDKIAVLSGTGEVKEKVNKDEFLSLQADVTTELGDKSSLPIWLQDSVREVTKTHDDYLRQFAVNVCRPPYNASSVGDSYDIIIQALEDMQYTGTIYLPGVLNISKPIHIGKKIGDAPIGEDFLVQNLIVMGDISTRVTKTTSTLDISGKDSIFYTNALATHFLNLGTIGLGHITETIAFNLRRFTTMSSIRNHKTIGCKTCVYLDSVYAGVDIIGYHANTCKQIFDSSTAEKTSINIDQIWGENIFKMGFFQYINYSHFGLLFCDWVNISLAEGNGYGNPVTFAEIINGVYEFYLCTSLKIDVLACEHANARSFVYYGSTSFVISLLHLVAFGNTTGGTVNSSGQTPIVALNASAGTKECIIDTIRCTVFTTITRIVYYPYASITYGSKFVPYLTLNNIPFDVATVSGSASTNNLDVMVKHPKSKYPIYWDKTTPDATAKPFRLKVDSVGVITSEAVPYYYYA